MGEPDPQRLLAGMTAERLQWWRAAFAVVPLDDGWRQTDEICRAVHDLGVKLFAALTGSRLDPRSFARPGSYIPNQRRRTPAIQTDRASIEAHERATRTYGNDR